MKIMTTPARRPEDLPTAKAADKDPRANHKNTKTDAKSPTSNVKERAWASFAATC
jgi:hypothetical protein